MAETARDLGQIRQNLDDVIEAQFDEAGVGALTPALEAGLLRLAPMEDREDLFDSYMTALWSVLKDRRYYPLLDEGMAKIVDAAVREVRSIRRNTLLARAANRLASSAKRNRRCPCRRVKRRPTAEMGGSAREPSHD